MLHFLSQVTVTDRAGKEVIFPANVWLSSDPGKALNVNLAKGKQGTYFWKLKGKKLCCSELCFRPNFNRPFSYPEKESQSNDTLLHFVEFSNVHNCDRSSNATRSNLVYKTV